ncbi:PGN_0703 family putative restriction endonuclease [Knoellia sp. CPCC 206450]|uniref:PGN_0703 family putative restriction endonuclease n=1 Tax=Knoellia tibetensis TaxID=3404798 RepID=UPI003B430950
MSRSTSFRDDQRSAAARWKAATSTLPEPARAAAPYVSKDGTVGRVAYDFCLPPSFASYNLLPDARDPALSLFAELGIRWHASAGEGPSNHLLSSQVQCANALVPMADDPERIIRVFGGVLDIDHVLEIEPGRFLTFEYIGPTDYFNESPGRERVRGAHCTSVDAAIRYRTPKGAIELALVEWKYVEEYRTARRPEPAKDATRRRRYFAAWSDPAGPVRDDLLPFEDVLDEPFYQLVRQQLLAHQLEVGGVAGADVVRVVHVHPAANDAYQQSLVRDSHRALGETVDQVWQQLLRSPDRFLVMDSDAFLDPTVTSPEYVNRYASDVAFNTEDLYALTEADSSDSLTFQLFEYDDGTAVVDEVGVTLWMGSEYEYLGYPLRLSELRDHSERMEAEEERRQQGVNADRQR